jgi:methyl-accepting chemotaxis protein
MKNLRIGAKLGVAFAIAIVALVALGIFSVAKLATLDERVTYMAVDQRDKQVAISNLDTAVAKFRIQQAVGILSEDPADIAKANRQMSDAAADVASNLAFLDGSLKSKTSREAMSKVAGDWTAFLAHARQTQALASANSNDAAFASFREENGLYRPVDAELASLMSAQSKNAREKRDDAHATYLTARTLTIALTMAVVMLLGALLVTLVRSIARPIAGVTQALTGLAHGKTDATMARLDRRDEVGDLADAMVDLRDQLAAAERAKGEQVTLIVDSVGTALSKLAEGDLVARVDADLDGPFGKLKTDFNAAADSLRSTLMQVSEAASGINSGASDIRQASDDLSQRTEQQAASLEQTAAAMDEITATVRTTAERAGGAHEAVRLARDEAEHSGEVVARAVDAMGGIERTSNEISEIISVIDGIAFQTNLLALNAGVEAARAGDAGKGFAVVASEVRALAQRSAEAAKDVKTRITASSVQVEAGVELVAETGKALDRIIRRIGEINGLVEEIAASAEHQATGLQQVNTAMSEMDGVTQQNAAMVEQATAAARSLATEADGMAQQIARFRVGETGARAASTVHPMRTRPATERPASRPTPRTVGNTAVALAEDDWSAF